MRTLIDPAPGSEVPAWAGPGTTIDGRYRILEPLGEGGMGMVWIAEHLGLHRRVALKVLRTDIADDPSVLKRFEREAQTLASLSHPNIVALNDYGVWQGTPYLVMELLQGKTLGELLGARSTLSVERALGITQQLLRALSYAHVRGVIHRDLKPGNVFLQALPDHDDHVKLLDFGFAKFVDAAGGSLVTAKGIVVGTPTYMAPEAATGVELDARADVYAVGVLLFEMLTGARPFEGEPIELLRRRLTEDAPTMVALRPDLALPPTIDRAVARALARSVTDRWQTAAELASALATQPVIAAPRAHVEPSAKPVGPRLAWIGVVAALGLVALAWSRWPATPASTARVIAPSAPPESIAIEHASPPPSREEVIDVAVSAATAPAPPSDTPPPETTASAVARPLVDPWDADMPAELRALRRRIRRPAPPERSDIRELRTYAQAHRDDPRGVLLLAHAFARMHWMDEALETYTRALAMSSAGRGDPEVLPNLITLAASGSTARGASALVESNYGAEAIPVIDATLAAPSLRPEDRERLEALRARVAAPE